jgi:hypothetical protein
MTRFIKHSRGDLPMHTHKHTHILCTTGDDNLLRRDTVSSVRKRLVPFFHCFFRPLFAIENVRLTDTHPHGIRSLSTVKWSGRPNDSRDLKFDSNDEPYTGTETMIKTSRIIVFVLDRQTLAWFMLRPNVGELYSHIYVLCLLFMYKNVASYQDGRNKYTYTYPLVLLREHITVS